MPPQSRTPEREARVNEASRAVSSGAVATTSETLPASVYSSAVFSVRK